ncbi:MAG: hypothetical protein ACK4TC_08400 [Sphingomonas pseudosanguinis]|uniref:hypothetical protein n=1 Tax=Sphingomonas pseudosanguinis TaxID=413712 RepID=UPI00391CB375
MTKTIIVALIVVTISGCSEPPEPTIASSAPTATPARMTPLQLEGLRSVLNRCRIPAEQRQCAQHELRRLGPEDRDAVMNAVPKFMLK